MSSLPVRVEVTVTIMKVLSFPIPNKIARLQEITNLPYHFYRPIYKTVIVHISKCSAVLISPLQSTNIKFPVET